jgi:peptidyl-prolyl cis-trans isomerase SurA
MTKMKESWSIALATILLHLALAGTVAAEVVDRIVAEVNDEIITMSELQNMGKAIEAQSGVKPTGKESKDIQRQMLEALIDRKLAKAEAKRRGIAVPDKEVDEALGRFKQRNNLPNDEALAKALSNEGLSFKEFKQQLKDQMTQDRLLAVAVGAKVTVSDADVRRIYDERFKKGGSSQLHLWNVRLPFPPGATSEQKEEVKRKAESILSDVKRGASLAEAAQKVSANATDLGYVSQSDLDPRLGDYLEKLKPKEVAPVETPEGYQLVQLLGRRTGEARPFEEVAPEIRRLLQQREMEKQFNEWVKTLRDKSHIKIML